MRISKNWETKGRIGWMISDSSTNCYLELSKKHFLHPLLSSKSRWKKLTRVEDVGEFAVNYLDKGVYNGLDALLYLGGRLNRPVRKTFKSKVIRRIK